MAVKTATRESTVLANVPIQPLDFVHLHNHSHYSLLDGLQKIPEMLERVKSLGMEAVALTDHGTLSGTIEFYQLAQEKGLKPIIGMEAYIAPRSHTDKVGKADASPFHLILLAMNNQGYQNLLKLASIAHLEGFYYKPRIDRELLKTYQEGLIVLSGCAGSELGDALKNDQIQLAEETARWYKKVFGDRYYLEVQDHAHEWALQAKLNKHILALATKLNIPAVVTSDAHYTLAEDQEAHEVLLCVQTGSLLSDEKRMSLRDMHLFVSDPTEIARRWQDHPEVLTNTKLIADRCQVEIEFGKILVPNYPTPKGETEQQHLEKLAYQGLAWRYGNSTRASSAKLDPNQIKKKVSQEQIERLEFELSVIKKMGFASYFLIVADFINWAKQNGIVVGPGRGSAASSIVAYALGITELEPLRYDLLFERFLNPERISMPDFDIDFQDDRRDEVIRYVASKYGEDRVANIVTFGKMAARNAVRDTARVLGVSYGDADRLAKMFPPPIQGRQVPLQQALATNQELKTEYAQNSQSKQVIDLALRLEGTIRSHGVHAAGVVIAPDEITKITPLEMAQKGVIATQYSMGPIEELGLLKIDFLGLSNLTVIKNALRIIRKVYKKDINVADIPLNDAKTFALLSRGETTGVFQLESTGMKRYIKQLQPDLFEDIIAMVALYRPGPLTAGLTQKFIDRKIGKEPVSYEHESMRQALESTYGVLVYQEQVMRIARDMCGFSGGQADTLRKAIGKKKRDVMARMKKDFIEGARQTSGVDRSFAEKFWKDLEGFADYAFNKAHAAGYGLVAYQTAYLKAHYPAAFMAALMTSDHENTDRIAIELAECKQMEIEVLPPDINESFAEFAVVPATGAIRFGLAATKNVGIGAVEKILDARAHGKFKSVEDFARRVSLSDVNRKTWESLIKAGAFDSLGERAQLLFNLDNITSFASRIQKEVSAGQGDLFGDLTNISGVIPALALAAAPEELSERERLGWERDLLGVYLSRHPLDSFADYLKQTTTPIRTLSSDHENHSVVVGGLITAIRKLVTRSGANMAFVTLEDLSDKIELIVFPRVYESFLDLWKPDRVVKVTGKLNSKDRDGQPNGEMKILVDQVETIESSHQPVTAAPPSDSRLVIQLPQDYDIGKLAEMKNLLVQYSGDSEVVIKIGTGDTQIKLPFTVKADADLRARLEELFMSSAVAITI